MILGTSRAQLLVSEARVDFYDTLLLQRAEWARFGSHHSVDELKDEI